MKKLLVGISVVSILAVGAIAYSHGFGGWSGGHMMGPGYVWRTHDGLGHSRIWN